MKFKKIISIVLSGLLVVSSVMLPSTNFVSTAFANEITGQVNESLSTPTIRATSSDISWDKVENAMGYKVFRSTSENGEYEEVAEIEELGSSISSYHDYNLKKEKTFYFKIKAFYVLPSKEFIYSDYSNIISLKYPLLVPVGVTVSSINGNSNNVTWSKSHGVDGYKIFRSTIKYNGYELIGEVKDIGENSQSFEDKNIVANQRYYYKIANYVIVDGVEVLSDLSSRAEILTKLKTPTVTVTNLENTNIIKWSKVPDATGYKILYRGSNYDSYRELVDIKNGDTLSYAHEGLEYGRTYYYKVMAYNSENYSEYAYSTVKPTLFVPESVKALSVHSNCNKVTWSKSPGSHGYYIYRSKNKYNGYSIVASIDDTGESTQIWEDVNVSANQRYYYKIASYILIDGDTVLSDFSEIVEITTKLETTMISTLTNFKNTTIIGWDEVPYATGYKLLYCNTPNGSYRELIDIKNGDTLSYAHEGLEYGRTYYYKVMAYNSETYNITEYNVSVTVKFSSAPIKAKATQNTYNSNQIAWDKVLGADGYEIYRATSKTGKYSSVKTTRDLSYINTGLTTEKTYYYKVRAYRVVNGAKVYSNYSNIVSAKPSLNKPNVILTVGSKKITIKWNKISGANGYQIYRSKSEKGKYSLIKATTSSSYSNTKLKKGTRYYYKVRAYKVVNGKKIYGSYSSIKNIKVK